MPSRPLKDLPPKLLDLAIQRAREQMKEAGLNYINPTVSSSFTWSITPEGLHFWDKINDPSIPIPEEWFDEKKPLKVKLNFHLSNN